VTNQEIGKITYSYGQIHDMTERPNVYGADMWQVHSYSHEWHRITWDVSRGRVYASYAETYRMGRRHFGWQHDRDVTDPLPITLEAPC
jgi:hypothetical protein